MPDYTRLRTDLHGPINILRTPVFIEDDVLHLLLWMFWL
jgi:hypothetical protein